MPGAFGDAFRAVDALPGVTPIISGLPFFFVRGSPPGNVGTYIDGVRVPLLFHLGAGPSVVLFTSEVPRLASARRKIPSSPLVVSPAPPIRHTVAPPTTDLDPETTCPISRVGWPAGKRCKLMLRTVSPLSGTW